MKVDHIPGYIKNEKRNHPPKETELVNSVVNNTTTTTTNQTTENVTNNAFTVNIQYSDIYRAKYNHHPRHNNHRQNVDINQLFRSTLSDIVNLKFNCYRRDFLINFLNSMF